MASAALPVEWQKNMLEIVLRPWDLPPASAGTKLLKPQLRVWIGYNPASHCRVRSTWMGEATYATEKTDAARKPTVRSCLTKAIVLHNVFA